MSDYVEFHRLHRLKHLRLLQVGRCSHQTAAADDMRGTTLGPSNALNTRRVRCRQVGCCALPDRAL